MSPEPTVPDTRKDTVNSGNRTDQGPHVLSRARKSPRRDTAAPTGLSRPGGHAASRQLGTRGSGTWKSSEFLDLSTVVFSHGLHLGKLVKLRLTAEVKTDLPLKTGKQPVIWTMDASNFRETVSRSDVSFPAP